MNKTNEIKFQKNDFLSIKIYNYKNNNYQTNKEINLIIHFILFL